MENYESLLPLILGKDKDALAIVVKAIVGETTTTLRWRSRCRAGDDGDQKHKMMMAISCHIF